MKKALSLALKIRYLTATISLLALSTAAHAQVVNIPGSADAGRINPKENLPELKGKEDKIELPKAEPAAQAPEGAKKVHFTLKEVEIKGSTVFTNEQLAEIYQPYIGKETTMDVAWEIAAKITDKYHNAGYFLSRAYVPEQFVKHGKIIIKISEGYIGDVELDNKIAGRRIVKSMIADIKSKKPVKASEVESFLLRLNDLPGTSYRAVLSTNDEKGADENSVKLTLVATKEKGHGSVSFDNYGSRFLGPNEMTVSYQTSIIPQEQTTVSVLTSTPTNELKYGSIEQSIPIFSDISLDLNASKTKAEPGYSLSQYDIDSEATSMSAAVKYQAIRQREKNLSLKFDFDGKNTSNTISDVPFNRDHVRAVRGTADFDMFDKWQGYDSIDFILSQGIAGLGASDKGDPSLSRLEALPDFTKVNLSLSRMQRISDDWNIIGSLSGQKASGPLFSSEEFGYGGQVFGRAYDSSEITGDDGVDASLELRFQKFAEIWHDFSPIPYIFYDAGKVWSYDSSQVDTASGSSAGFGIRFASLYQITGNLGLAFPITREQANPIYGQDNNGPRILLQISKGF